MAQHFPKEHWDPEGMYASWRLTLSPIAYNTSLVKAEDAPKGFNDLLDPKWVGKIVKAHPGYSGTIMTATQQLARDLGWGYFEKLAKQKIMQVQSAADPPKKLALGERAVMADGGEYVDHRPQGARRAGRGGLCRRRHAADHRPVGGDGAGAPTPTRRGCSTPGR